MPFCSQCGSPIDGQFCAKCGARAGVPAASDTPPPTTPGTPPVHQPPGSQAYKPAVAAAGTGAPRKRSPWVWIVGGCFGLIVLGAILAVSTGYFLVNKAKQAGFDPALMQKNPGLAVAKILATVNPEIEVLAVDENRGIIKVRNKKDGKTLTMNLEDVKNGRIVFMDENNQKVELQAKGEGDQASLEVRTPDGSMRMGAGAAQLPEWLPAYPGSQGAGTFGMSAKEGNAGSYAFKTSASAADVASFYEKALKDAGFEVEKTENDIPGQGSTVILAANDAGTQRSAQITAIGAGGETQVNLIFETKK